VQRFRGFSHFDLGLLSGEALRLHEMGLVPAPKEGKALPIGFDRKCPTHLWDWARYRTLGTMTGPDHGGILVLDIDDPDKFRKFLNKGDKLNRTLWDHIRAIEGAMVCCRKGVDPQDVREFNAPGKIIMRYGANADHPLAQMSIGQYLKGRGYDVFYGKGVPSQGQRTLRS
jgi:hypothetical protein